MFVLTCQRIWYDIIAPVCCNLSSRNGWNINCIPGDMLWRSAWYLLLVDLIDPASSAVWKWSILCVFYYRSRMNRAAMVRTSQNGHFFIKFMFLPQVIEHPHGICLLVNLVHSASPTDWKWSIPGAVYYMSWMKSSAVVRTSQNGSFFIKSTFLPQWSSMMAV